MKISVKMLHCSMENYVEFQELMDKTGFRKSAHVNHVPVLHAWFYLTGMLCSEFAMS